MVPLCGERDGWLAPVAAHGTPYLTGVVLKNRLHSPGAEKVPVRVRDDKEPSKRPSLWNHQHSGWVGDCLFGPLSQIER